MSAGQSCYFCIVLRVEFYLVDIVALCIDCWVLQVCEVLDDGLGAVVLVEEESQLIDVGFYLGRGACDRNVLVLAYGER